MHRLQIHRSGVDGIAIATRCADNRGERDDDIGIFGQVFDDPLVASVPIYKLKAGVRGQVKRTMLPVGQIVHRNDLKSCLQQMFAQNRTDIPGPAGYENLHFVRLPGMDMSSDMV